MSERETAEWLRRLKWALGSLGEQDRDEIVAEAAAHIDESLGAGRPAAEVLAGFGPPDAYARRFLDEAELARALGGQRATDLAGAVISRVHRSLVAAIAGAGALVICLVMFMAVTVVVMEIQNPVATGLWIGPTQQFIGQIDDPNTPLTRDVLGVWLIPAAGAVIGGGILALRFLLLAAVRRLARPA